MPKIEYEELSKKVLEIAWPKHVSFYQNKHHLEGLIDTILAEILESEVACKKEKILKSEQIKAVWVLSGAGTYFTPITDLPGDRTYRDKTWAHWSDRDRLDYAAKIIRLTGDNPYLIYNGVAVQDEALRKAAKQNFPVKLERIYFPKGRIKRTIDQARNLTLPEELRQEGIVLGVVSHAPHLARVVRILNYYKPLSNIKLKLFPLPSPCLEFTLNEILGIIDYIASGQATERPYPFEL